MAVWINENSELSRFRPPELMAVWINENSELSRFRPPRFRPPVFVRRAVPFSSAPVFVRLRRRIQRWILLPSAGDAAKNDLDLFAFAFKQCRHADAQPRRRMIRPPFLICA